MANKRMSPHQSLSQRAGAVLGIAFYRPEQWRKLRRVAADKEVFHDTHAEWLEAVSQQMQELRQMGYTVRLVDVDIDELVVWCRQHGCPINGKARSQFVAEKLWENDDRQDKGTP